jgi:hypothetical protein
MEDGVLEVGDCEKKLTWKQKTKSQQRENAMKKINISVFCTSPRNVHFRKYNITPIIRTN